MSRRGATGAAMNLVAVRTRFVPDSKTGPKLDAKLSYRITEVRRLLRTDLPLGQVADQLGVSDATLRNFVKRRRLCDLGERTKWIGRQKRIAAA